MSREVKAISRAFDGRRSATEPSYQIQIERLDAQIDGLVCELYGLTEEEVGAVESLNR